MPAARIRIVARLGRGRSRLPPFVLWSAAGHGLFLAAVILLPSLRPHKRFPDVPIVVDLVSAPHPAAAAAPPAPPEPEPASPPETARLETREPPKPKKPLPDNPKPKPKPEKKPEKKPPPAPPRHAPAGPPGPESAPATPAATGAGPGGGSITALEGGDVRFAWYRDSVTAALHSHWRRPILEGLTEPIEVRVTFDILRDGSVTNLRVDSPSGVPVFDRSALRAVQDASPLPPLPLEWREPTLAAAFVFLLHPD